MSRDPNAMNNRDRTDDTELALEEYFAEARRASPEPSDALMSRILADASLRATASRRGKPLAQARPQPAHATGLGNFWSSLENRLVAGVLATSVCAGFLAGFLNVQMSSELVMAMIQDADVYDFDFVAVPTIEDLFPEELS